MGWSVAGSSVALAATLVACASPTPDWAPPSAGARHVAASAQPSRLSGAPSDALATSDDVLFTRSALGELSELAPARADSVELAPYVSRALAADDRDVYAGVVTHASGSGALLAFDRFDGTHSLLAPTAAPPLAIVADDLTLFWAERGPAGSIRAVPKSGGVSTTLLAQSDATALALRPPWLYWADARGQVGRVASTGGDSSLLVSAAGPVVALATSPSRLLWIAANQLVSAAQDGSDASVLVTDELASVLVVADDFAYFATADGLVERVSLAGGTPQVLARNQHEVSALALDATRLYFACLGTGSGDLAGAGVFATRR